MPTYDYKLLISDAQAMATATFSVPVYSTDVVNFGMTTPNIEEGNMFGLHALVTTTFTSLSLGANLWIVTSSSAAPTSADNHSGMYIPVAELVAGAHFFIPVGSRPVKQYARASFAPVGTTASAGNLTMWFGPKEGAEV